jgi:hypothetical protein
LEIFLGPASHKNLFSLAFTRKKSPKERNQGGFIQKIEFGCAKEPVDNL